MYVHFRFLNPFHAFYRHSVVFDAALMMFFVKTHIPMVLTKVTYDRTFSIVSPKLI